MQSRKLFFGMGIALWMFACTRTPLPSSRDAAVEVQLPSDAYAHTDLVPSNPDSTTLAPDVSVPDAEDPDVVARDVAFADLADVFAYDVKFSDAASEDAATPDARNTAGLDLAGRSDTSEVAANPLAGRSFRIDDVNPAPTPDPTCTPRPVSFSEFTFSSDLSSLTGTAASGSTAWKFSANAGSESNKLTYHVTNLMGGQVFLESDQGVYVAQVILYGSGVPVMWCLRGALMPQP